VYKLEELDRRYQLIKAGHRLVDLGCAPGSWLQYLAKALGKKGAVVGYDLAELEVNPGKNVRTWVADVETLTPERVRADLAQLILDLKTKPAAPPDAEVEGSAEPEGDVPEGHEPQDGDEPQGDEPQGDEPDGRVEPGAPPAPPNLRIDGLVSDMAPKLSGIRDADQARSVAINGHALRLADALVVPGGYFVAKLFQGRDTDEFVAEVKRVFKDVKLQKPEATRDGSREVFVVARLRKPA
jgi:23S rRNA (uridine2552-2'-O)-methyltransferase